MFKDTVKYTDWDDKEQVDVLHFNITKSDLLSDLALLDRAEAVMKTIEGPARELSTPEKQEILNVTIEFMRISYGIKSVDGRHFRKTPEIWADFKATKAYDEYLLSLFLDTDKANAFMSGVMPKDLREQALREGRLQAPSVSETAGEEIVPEIKDERPRWLIDNRAPSMDELKASDPKWHAEAFRLKLDASK